jgi:hypothetical protein
MHLPRISRRISHASPTHLQAEESLAAQLAEQAARLAEAKRALETQALQPL